MDAKKQTLHIYRRVSSDVQGEEGYGLELQLEAGQYVAKQLGFNTKIWDEGTKSSTKNDLSNRPELSELLKQVSQGGVEHLYVYNENRLSRNRNSWAYITNQLINGGVKIYEERNLTPKDLSNHQDAFIFEIMRSVSVLEQSQRMSRLSAGKLERVKKGKWQGGPPPYGYMINDTGFLKKEIKEAKWVKFIFENYIEGMTILDIKKKLFENAVRTRRGKTEWSTASIRLILSKNSHYQGTYNYKRGETGEEVEVVCDRIVSQSLFNKARKLFEQRSYNSKGRIRDVNIKTKTLLKDFLVCGHCGTKFGQKVYKLQNRNHYYCRSGEKNHLRIENRIKCKERMQSIKIDKANEIVWNSIVDVLSQSKIYEKSLTGWVDTANHHFSFNKEDLNVIKRSVKSKKKELNATLELIARDRAFSRLPSTTKDEKEEMKSNRRFYEERKEEQILEIGNLENRLMNAQENKKIKSIVIDFDKTIELMKSDDFSDEDKREKLDYLVEKIFVKNTGPNEHELKVRFKLPFVGDDIEWIDHSNNNEGGEIIGGNREFVIKHIENSNYPKKN